MTLAEYVEQHPELRGLYRQCWRTTVAVLSEQFTWEEIAAEFATVQALPVRVAILGGIRPAARCLFTNKDLLARAVCPIAHEKHKQRCREYPLTREHGELLANATVEQNKILLQILEALTRIATALEARNE